MANETDEKTLRFRESEVPDTVQDESGEENLSRRMEPGTPGGKTYKKRLPGSRSGAYQGNSCTFRVESSRNTYLHNSWRLLLITRLPFFPFHPGGASCHCPPHGTLQYCAWGLTRSVVSHRHLLLEANDPQKSSMFGVMS